MCKLCNKTGKYRGITGKANFCWCSEGARAFEEAVFEPESFAALSRAEQIAWLVRKRVEMFANTHRYKRNLQHLCGLASVSLFTALKREGFSAQIAEGGVGGTYHCWVLHEGKIIDVTFTQFDINSPPVLITNKDDARYRQMRLYRKPRRLATTTSDLTWRAHVEFVSNIDATA